MKKDDFKSWLSFILPPVLAIAVAYGATNARLNAIEKQQDRNTELILDILKRP
jgi:hypothetical protein